MAVTRVCSGLIASGGRINETMIFPSLFLATSDRGRRSHRRRRPRGTISLLEEGTAEDRHNSYCLPFAKPRARAQIQNCRNFEIFSLATSLERFFVSCSNARGQVHQQTHHTVERGLLSGPLCRSGVEWSA